jgi:hypothetical protein
VRRCHDVVRNRKDGGRRSARRQFLAPNGFLASEY